MATVNILSDPRRWNVDELYTLLQQINQMVLEASLQQEEWERNIKHDNIFWLCMGGFLLPGHTYPQILAESRIPWYKDWKISKGGSLGYADWITKHFTLISFTYISKFWRNVDYRAEASERLSLFMMCDGNVVNLTTVNSLIMQPYWDRLTDYWLTDTLKRVLSPRPPWKITYLTAPVSFHGSIPYEQTRAATFQFGGRSVNETPSHLCLHCVI